MTIPSLQGPSIALRIIVMATLWLCLISLLHATLNGEKQSPRKVLMGYMPVVANLAAPLVDAVSRGRDVQFEALKFGSFAEIAEAFRAKHIQAAFIIAPMAIALHQQGVPLRVVYIGNRHESTLVVRQNEEATSIHGLSGKTIAVPIRYSGHLLALKRHLRGKGMGPESIRIVEVPPPDMHVALTTGSIDGYFVGEPFASKSIKSGDARRFLDVETIWPKFICNLMIVREELITGHPQWVQDLVNAAVRSGFWAQTHIDEAIDLAGRYWGQDPEVVRLALTDPPGRVRFDLYTPVREELEEIGREMQLAGLIEGPLNVSGMVDDRFARKVESGALHELAEIFGGMTSYGTAR